MKNIFKSGLFFFFILLASLLLAQDKAETILQSAIEPGYRNTDSTANLDFNPFEPITDARSDSNSELSQAMLKRIKGYVVQPNGAPLLVIDDKSYRVRDKVPVSTAAKSNDTKKDTTGATPAPAGGDTVTILSISQTEAVFQKEDASGFGGETFNIFFNFKHEVDDSGKTNYNVWEMVGNGFFVNDDGVIVIPLEIAQGSELSVLTPYGYSKATLVDSDSKRGLGLLKVNVKSVPLYLAEKKAELADEIFPVGYPIEQKVGMRFLEGFIKSENGTQIEISPEVDGSLLGSVVLNRKAEAVGILLGQTQGLTSVEVLSAKDSIFRKYLPSKLSATDSDYIPSQSMIEESVVKIFRKK